MRGCSVAGCESKHVAKGLCKNHYYRQYRKARRRVTRQRLGVDYEFDSAAAATRGPAQCAIAGCARVKKARGLCNNHYEVFRLRGSWPIEASRKRWRGSKCTVCDDEAAVLGLCRVHYRSHHHTANREHNNALAREHYVNNKASYLDRGARRRALTRTATPKWLTEEQRSEIMRVYESCPPGYHVDHIVPLRGKDVSGLHVPWNLQYLPAAENLRKSNKYSNSRSTIAV